MRRANGMGTIIKLTGNRRKPWAIRRVVGWTETGKRLIKYQGYYKTRREAEKALNEFNNDPYTISRKTFSDVYKEWYALKEKEKADGTLKGYRICYGHLSALHDMRIQEIDRNTLMRVYDEMQVNKTAFRKVTQLVNMVFDHAVKRGILPLNARYINKAIVLPSKQEKRRKSRTVFTKDEINKLWEIKDVNEYAKIILVYLYTGLRFSELYKLDPEDCHADYIEVKNAKTAAGNRIVPLSDKVKSLLPIIKVPSRNALDRHLKKIFPDHLIHETRHTFITMLTETGADPRIIKAIVGHATNDVTDVYTHISLGAMLDAVNKL